MEFKLVKAIIGLKYKSRGGKEEERDNFRWSLRRRSKVNRGGKARFLYVSKSYVY